jgi:hypothetical protein
VFLCGVRIWKDERRLKLEGTQVKAQFVIGGIPSRVDADVRLGLSLVRKEVANSGVVGVLGVLEECLINIERVRYYVDGSKKGERRGGCIC